MQPNKTVAVITWHFIPVYMYVCIYLYIVCEYVQTRKYINSNLVHGRQKEISLVKTSLILKQPHTGVLTSGDKTTGKIYAHKIQFKDALVLRLCPRNSVFESDVTQMQD